MRDDDIYLYIEYPTLTIPNEIPSDPGSLPKGGLAGPPAQTEDTVSLSIPSMYPRRSRVHVPGPEPFVCHHVLRVRRRLPTAVDSLMPERILELRRKPDGTQQRPGHLRAPQDEVLDHHEEGVPPILDFPYAPSLPDHLNHPVCLLVLVETLPNPELTVAPAEVFRGMAEHVAVNFLGSAHHPKSLASSTAQQQILRGAVRGPPRRITWVEGYDDHPPLPRVRRITHRTERRCPKPT